MIKQIHIKELFLQGELSLFIDLVFGKEAFDELVLINEIECFWEYYSLDWLWVLYHFSFQ